MIQLHHGNCLDLMKDIPAGSVDMVLCDLPYGVTRNKKDIPLPLDVVWTQYKRVIKPNGAICLFGQGMFTALLMLSNPEWWRYNLVWDKVLTTGFLNANRQPLRCHEEVSVFYQKQPTYNPQKFLGQKSHSKGKGNNRTNHNYGDYGFVDNSELHGNMKFPTSILRFQKPAPSNALHPTEKPVALCEYLIRTYTDPGQTVLDNCMGSGTTGVACVNTGRNFIGIELDEKYYKTAEERIFLAQSSVKPYEQEGETCVETQT